MPQESSPSGSFEQRLEALRRQFVTGLATRVATLRAALEGSDPADERKAALREACHKLTGTAGSYGFLEVSELAREIEVSLVEGADLESIAPRVETLVQLCVAIRGEETAPDPVPAAPPPERRHPPASTVGSPSREAIGVATSTSVGRRILVIDDDEATRRLLGLTLTRMGKHEATVVGSGEEGLALLDGRPFDLVIVDAMMPDMNGPTFVHLVRTTKPEYARTRVVICSAASADEIAAPLDPPPDGWLRKPIRPQSLLAELEPYLTPLT